MKDLKVVNIEQHIYFIRGHKVMLSPHLAELYGVETKALVQAVKRNSERFPEDFMFQLTWEETGSLRSQIMISSSRSQFVTLKKGRNIKYLPYAFTEQGVAMLSSVLRSQRAVQMNIAIMRAFVRFREAMTVSREFAKRLEDIEKRFAGHDLKLRKYDRKIQAIFDALRELMAVPQKPAKQIGFKL